MNGKGDKDSEFQIVGSMCGWDEGLFYGFRELIEYTCKHKDDWLFVKLMKARAIWDFSH